MSQHVGDDVEFLEVDVSGPAEDEQPSGKRPKTFARHELQHARRMGRVGHREALYQRDLASRPRVRGDCVGHAHPCPWVSCKWHLYLSVNPLSGAMTVNFPDREPDELKETCALDVADRGGTTLEQVGDYVNLTRERIRQVETIALVQIRRRRRTDDLR